MVFDKERQSLNKRIVQKRKQRRIVQSDNRGGKIKVSNPNRKESLQWENFDFDRGELSKLREAWELK